MNLKLKINNLLKPIAKIKKLYYYNYGTNPKKNKRKRHKKMIKAETIAAVERERERERATTLKNNQAKKLALLNEYKRQTISK